MCESDIKKEFESVTGFKWVSKKKIISSIVL